MPPGSCKASEQIRVEANLSDLQRFTFERDTYRLDLDGLAIAGLDDLARHPRTVARVGGQLDASWGVGGIDPDGEAGAHVERRVRLATLDRAGPHQELKDCRRFGDLGDPINKRLRQPHQL